MDRFVLPEINSVADAEALLSAIITSSDDAIISKDLSGIVRSWNPSAERIFGYTAAEIVGKSITVLFPPDRLDEEPRSKSTEEGLELAFNSLDAQRESAEACISAQRHEGWTCNGERYDDGGFSGGTIERPALKRLLADIEAGKVDCVVVYKVDRLSRSLMDFARIMQVFDARKVSFVSVTQQFNTTHSMGRLTLNILLSFAQFEREIISERTRDKMAAAGRRGSGPAVSRYWATTSSPALPAPS